MATSRLHAVAGLGQSIWIDFLSRELVQSGGLERMVEAHAVTGVTSNPTIFQKALAESSLYDTQLAGAAAQGASDEEIFIALGSTDVADACDVLRPVYERTGRRGRLRVLRGGSDARLRRRGHRERGRAAARGHRQARTST